MARITRGISLEEWEEKTLLTEAELVSVYEIQEACAELPLPASWSQNDKSIASPMLIRSSSSGVQTPDSSSSSNLPLTPLNAGALSNRLTQLSTRSRSASNLLVEANAAEKKAMDEIGMEKPIETLQQFFDWFAGMEAGMEKDQEDVYRNYLSVVALYRESCDDFLEDLAQTTQLFDALAKEYSFVEQQTRSLQTSCEALLEEQERQIRLADALAERLAHFNQLEPIAKLFNAPGDDICRHPEFINMLQTLDECIEYMQGHLKYRDAELYLMRFRQCLTRGMTLIKMYTINTIKTLGYDVYKQISSKTTDQKLLSSKQTTLLYTKYRMAAPTIKQLSTQLKKRCEGHKEFNALYRDMIHAYFQTRQNLLGPIISRKILEIGPNGDLLHFARNGCAYMMGLCSDEFNLFYNFFPSGEEELYGYLDTLTSYLYDHLRPRIIHENSISVLSELCTIFQMYTLSSNKNI